MLTTVITVGTGCAVSAVGRPCSLWEVFIRVLVSTSARRGGLPLSGATKEAKRSYPQRSERTKNHRGVEIYYRVGDKRLAVALFCIGVSVIFRFLLCASWVLFTAHLYLKALSTKLTATFLFHRVTQLSNLFYYPLPTHYSTVDRR